MSKKTNDFFSTQELEKIRKEKAEKSGFKPKMPGGGHELTFISIEEKKTKKGDPMLHIVLRKSDEFKDLEVYLAFGEANTDISKGKIVDFLERGFEYKIQPCNSLGDLVKQVKQFTGKKLCVAVKIQTQLYDNKEGETVIVKSPEFWYCDSIKFRATFRVDMGTIIKPLNKKDLERYNKIIDLTGKAPREISTEESSTDSQTSALVNEAKRLDDANTSLSALDNLTVKKVDDDDDGLPF